MPVSLWGLRGRVALTSLALGLVAVVVLALVLSSMLRALMLDQVGDGMQRAARLIAARLADVPPPELWDAWTRRQAEAAEGRVTLIAADGRVVADSEVTGARRATMDNHRARPEVAAALVGRSGRSERASPTLGEAMLYVATPTLGGSGIRVVRLAQSIARIEGVVAGTRFLVVGGCGVALLMAIVVSVLSARSTRRAVSELTDVARTLAAGDFSRRAVVPSKDEVGALCDAMNQLAEALQQSVGRLGEERDLLTAILDGLEEGVLVVGPDGRVLRTNPALSRSLGAGVSAQDQPFSRVGLAELEEALDECLRETRVVNRELSLEKPSRRLLVSVAPLRTGRGAVALFHDISAIRRLEAVRRDFVSNVSHELRTPVTALRAAAETLLAGAMHDPTQAASFLAMIHRHAERLSNLISDLLDLSRLESGEMKLSSAVVSLARVAEEALLAVDEHARRKHLKVDAVVGALTCRGDPRAVEQVLVNLLDNAVKYTPEGGAITVRAERDGARVRVSVADTGPGIGEKHLERVFQRFYRVDPGRSREVGGTGLGLAIVKHLVEQMGGEVLAESVVGQGSTFSFRLPSNTA